MFLSFQCKFLCNRFLWLLLLLFLFGESNSLPPSICVSSLADVCGDYFLWSIQIRNPFLFFNFSSLLGKKKLVFKAVIRIFYSPWIKVLFFNYHKTHMNLKVLLFYREITCQRNHRWIAYCFYSLIHIFLQTSQVSTGFWRCVTAHLWAFPGR